MVERGSAGEPGRAERIPGDVTPREQRGLDRCRRALERGRRVRGRPIASSEQHGLLVDLRGTVGHVPAADAAARPPGNRWRGGQEAWEGWVVAVSGDLVHLAARWAGEEGGDAPIRRAEVMSTTRSGAVVRLDDGSPGVLPWEELSWLPSLGPPELPAGTRLEGRIVALTLEGPVFSPRAVAPSPWPAIALALPPGTDVGVHVVERGGGHALLRTDRAPRAAALVPEDALPPDGVSEATVVRVNAIAGALVLEDLRSGSRAPRPAREARRQGPQGPEQAASGSRS
jgi:hypothetical protein